MRTFVYADPHFGHKGVTQFLRADGTKLRPWDDVTKMDKDLVELYNSVVRPNDRVYFLGDVTFKPTHLHTLGGLHGSKVLIKGNHDTLKLSQYTAYLQSFSS
jgi:calcineurin-like phosphoesterase family protein